MAPLRLVGLYGFDVEGAAGFGRAVASAKGGPLDVDALACLEVIDDCYYEFSFIHLPSSQL